MLPGVTVEAASPAIIEKVKSATTDGTGRYTIPDLRPGTYRVTFTLPGFKTVGARQVPSTGWRTRQSILLPRLFKISAQFDF